MHVAGDLLHAGMPGGTGTELVEHLVLDGREVVLLAQLALESGVN